MNYIDLMNEKAKIAVERAELDKREKELDREIKVATASYARTLYNRMCALAEEIDELGFQIRDSRTKEWICFEDVYLDNK